MQETTRRNLGLPLYAKADLATLWLDPALHSFQASNGARFSNQAARDDGEMYERWLKTRTVTNTH